MTSPVPQNRFRPARRRSRFYAGLLALVLSLTSMVAVGLVRANTSFAEDCFTLPGSQQPVCQVDRVTDDEIRAAVATPRDGAFFWSGSTSGVSVEEQAGNIAKGRHGDTLETRLADAGINMPSLKNPDGSRNPEAVRLWDIASTAMADQASGTSYVVLGDVLRQGNIWETLEFPALRRNPNVEAVVQIIASTGAETTIYVRDGEL